MQLPVYNNPKRPGRALLIEGGGMKGAFVGGAVTELSRVLRPEYFDIVVAVSAGACAAAYYVTEPIFNEQRMNFLLEVWRKEVAGKKLISFLNPLIGKTILDHKYLIHDIFGKRYRIRRENLDKEKATPLYIAISNVRTLELEFVRATADNLLDLLMAATAMPIATRGKYPLGDNLYTDGGVLSSLPIQEVISAGYTDIVTILTTPRSTITKPINKMLSFACYPNNLRLGRILSEKYHHICNESYQIAMEPPEGVQVLIIDPDEDLPVGRVDTDASNLSKSVDIGMQSVIKKLNPYFVNKKKEHWWNFWFRPFIKRKNKNRRHKHIA